MGIRTYGPNAVDWEERVDLDRLRTQRLGRLKEALDRSELGALLSFDFHNIRYMTSTHIGTWAIDKLIRFAVLLVSACAVLAGARSFVAIGAESLRQLRRQVGAEEVVETA